MENENLEYSRRRPLPLELLVEMHKCLPLADAINVLVNVPSFAFVDINKPRMLRTIRQLKTSLNGYIDILVGEDENNREELLIRNEIEWKPELDTLFRYGTWLTSSREFWMVHSANSRIVGMPEKCVENLILHLANSRSSQKILQLARMNFEGAELPTPTFLEPLFNEKQFRIENRILFESFELENEDGRIIQIYDGELLKYSDGRYKKLKLFIMNKWNRKMWFKITMNLDPSSKYIQRLKFTQWKMQSLEDVKKFIKFGDSFKEKDGNILEATENTSWNPNLDMFLRCGAAFSQIRHFKIKPNRYFCGKQLKYYVDFLISYISNTKHPEDFLESIDINFSPRMCFYFPTSTSLFIKNIWKVCYKGIRKGGKFLNFDEKKLHILSGKTTTTKLTLKNKKLEFTLANEPTNGAYEFDVELCFRNGLKEIGRIKIQKRKVDEIVELNENQVEKEQPGKKRKASNDDDDDGGEEDEDTPTCSSKIMKK